MTSTPSARSPYGRRIVWLAVIVLVLLAGYIAAWFYAASRLESEAERVIAGLNREDVLAECTNPKAAGFPFRLGLFCDGVSFADKRQEASVVAGSFRSAAQIYNPFRIVGELDGPARIEAPGLGVIDVKWDLMHASTRLATPLPVRSSLEARQISASREGALLFNADNMQGHLRPNGADVDLAMSFDALALDQALLQGRTLPPLSGTADISVKDGVALITAGDGSLRGQSATIRSLTLNAGGDAGFTLAGDISVDQDGLVDGDLQLSITNPNALSRVAEDAFPEARNNIRTAFAGLLLLGRNPTMPLRIVKGRATLGFIPLGTIRPL